MPSTKSAKSTTTGDSLGYEAKFWLSADKLRNNMHAAEYTRAERDRLPKAASRANAEESVNDVVLGLIFRKFISDSFSKNTGTNSSPLMAITPT
jgi:type I restriction enzyme M protein